MEKNNVMLNIAFVLYFAFKQLFLNLMKQKEMMLMCLECLIKSWPMQKNVAYVYSLLLILFFFKELCVDIRLVVVCVREMS